LPLRAETRPDGTKVLRPWDRSDWDTEHSTIAWCCTEEPEPFVGETTVIHSLAEELTALVGPEVYVQIRDRLGQ
jgi:hypothetical protein